MPDSEARMGLLAVQQECRQLREELDRLREEIADLRGRVSTTEFEIGAARKP